MSTASESSSHPGFAPDPDGSFAKSDDDELDGELEALASDIEARALELSRRCIDEMYADAFWQERFAERGRKFAEEDGLHHLRYLVESLRGQSAAPMANYARWLRSVLVARGMCTEDARETFRRLGHALAEALPEGGAALDHLEAADRALLHDGGAARALQEAAPALVRRALEIEQAGPSERIIASMHADTSRLVSYLGDALAGARPDLFTAHLAWVRPVLERHGIKAELVERQLRAIEMALAEQGTRWADEARAVIAQSRGGTAS